MYKRRDNGKQIKKGKATLDNRFVVPYNRDLLFKFQAHINVEWCNRSRSIKYLFKYIHKGVDYVVGLLKENTSKNEIDEIKKYLEMRHTYQQLRHAGGYSSLISTIEIRPSRG